MNMKFFKKFHINAECVVDTVIISYILCILLCIHISDYTLIIQFFPLVVISLGLKYMYVYTLLKKAFQ